MKLSKIDLAYVTEALDEIDRTVDVYEIIDATVTLSVSGTLLRCTLANGDWTIETVEVKKKPGRKPKPQTMTVTPAAKAALAEKAGLVQGAKGPVDPKRQEAAKRAAATRNANRAAKKAPAKKVAKKS